MADGRIWLSITLMALITAALRFLPFVIFRSGDSTPGWIRRLGELLPCAIMGMLVVYCLKDVHFASTSGFVPALVGCGVVGGLYLWKRNTLLSIVAGTVCYMLLVQLVF